MAWEIRATTQYHDWFWGLAENEQDGIETILAHLRDRGPGLGRPLADTIRGSRHSNMKELRCPGNVRILFAFDPNRTAILLLGGDKTKRWEKWYEEAIPVADRLFDEHLESLGRDD